MGIAYDAGFEAGKSGGTWGDCKFAGAWATEWFRGFEAGRNAPATENTMEGWRKVNPEPAHGCGHMQGRGAA